MPQIMAVWSAEAVPRMGSPIRDTDTSQIPSLCPEYLLNSQIDMLRHCWNHLQRADFGEFCSTAFGGLEIRYFFIIPS